jgi:predicted GNAT superfamily acetyltransferase
MTRAADRRAIPIVPDYNIRDLHTIEEFRQIVELERAIWGYSDAGDLVTVPVFIFTIRRGGILIAADDGQRLVGFAYSVVGMKDGQAMQWSHMTGVLPEHRGGLGLRLKLEQRRRALARGYDLIEWTFDPMQAMNAHFNLYKLGAVIEEYAENFYGESTSTLHRGTPTDRIIAHWRIREPHVARRVDEPSSLRVRAHETAEAPVANVIQLTGNRREPQSADLDIDARRVQIEIPTGFTDMQRENHELALEWRLHIRQLFQTYLPRGYRAVDFALHREAGFGRYLLARAERQT